MYQNEEKGPRVSRLAIASLVCGILTMTCIGSPVFFVPALITGHLANGVIKRSKGLLVGRWMAWWGMICGWLFVAAGLLAGFYLLHPPYRVVEQEVIGNTNGITVMLNKYAPNGMSSSGRAYVELILQSDVGDERVLHKMPSSEATVDHVKDNVSLDAQYVVFNTPEGDVITFPYTFDEK